MKRYNCLLPFLLLLILPGCETQKETWCFPGRISTTIADGTDATQVTADYQYEGERPDRVIYSNFQTHFFDYYADGTLRSVTRKNVQTFQALESIYTYEGGLVERSDEYRVRLDRFTQENVDTVQTGYRLFTYVGGNITLERVFFMDASTGDESLQAYNTCTYDAAGNMTTYISLDDINGDTLEAASFVYDTQKHPLRELGLVFEGETHVNNVLQRTDLLTGEVYNHQIIYTPAQYPEQINVKLGSYLVEVIRMDYTCN